MNIAIIGNPNAGKSAVLNRLTGSQLFVSNYPGTSIEVSKTNIRIGGQMVSVFDTPGIYSILSSGEEAGVCRTLFLNENIDLIINIVDAVNLERNLVLSCELLEKNIPVMVLLNQIDRSRTMGINIDVKLLARSLACPVLTFSATSGEGLIELMAWLEKGIEGKGFNKVREPIEERKRLIIAESGCTGQCQNCSASEESCLNPGDLLRAATARSIAGMVCSQQDAHKKKWLDKIQVLIDRPILGTIFLLLVAYLGFILLLNFIKFSEGPINALLAPINNIIENIVIAILPHGMISSVLTKAIPEGLIIPFTIIMPAMIMVSLLMAILEDTGLLPRYSVALERLGSLFGLSGQAVIPLSLGFGCRTPAIIATRIMPTQAQRFIIVTILSIIIPCAATLGILASIIAAFHASLWVLIVTMIVTLILLTSILGRLNPARNDFIYELPPLRIPLPGNIWSKIKIRFSGFFTEVLPLLLVMSIGIRALMESGALEVFKGMEQLSRYLFGIPAEALAAVLITIFQRYLAPLVLMNLNMTPREATIAISMIALSLPCLPMMVMTIRELGVKSLLKILGMGLTVSFTVGIVLNLILPY